MDLSFSSLNVYHALKYRKKRGREERFSKKHHSTSVNNDVYIRRNNGKHNLLPLVNPPFYGPCSLIVHAEVVLVLLFKISSVFQSNLACLHTNTQSLISNTNQSIVSIHTSSVASLRFNRMDLPCRILAICNSKRRSVACTVFIAP